MKREKIDSLIHLLDDPDEEIFNEVRKALVDAGPEAVKALELYWERNDFEPSFMHRVEDIIHDIQFNHTLGQLKLWIENGCSSLFDGAIIVAQYQYPDLEVGKLHEKIKEIGKKIWLELNNNLTSFEKVKIINHYIYKEYGFSGNRKNFHSPANSFLNNVLDSKKGNPLSLSLLYILIAEEINEPIVGVNLPNHFVVGYLDELRINAETGFGDHGVLFYINCFSKGMILQLPELESFLEQLKIDPDPSYFRPCSNFDIIRRMLINLKMAYQKIGEAEKEEEIDMLLSCFKKF